MNVYAADTAPASLYCQHVGTLVFSSPGPKVSLPGTFTSPTVTASASCGGVSMLMSGSAARPHTLGSMPSISSSTSTPSASGEAVVAGVDSVSDDLGVSNTTIAPTTMRAINTIEAMKVLLRLVCSSAIISALRCYPASKPMMKPAAPITSAPIMGFVSMTPSSDPWPVRKLIASIAPATINPPIAAAKPKNWIQFKRVSSPSIPGGRSGVGFGSSSATKDDSNSSEFMSVPSGYLKQES